jgi:DNA-binding GntR family transcriptional regulator
MDESALTRLGTALAKRQESGPAGLSLYLTLYEAIVQGDLRPGQALSEADLSRRLATSRQLVREAFIKLAERKLLSILPQRGTFVVRISPRRVLEAQWVREAIETRIAGEAARAASPELVAKLRDLVLRQRKVPRGDFRQFQELDDAFHRTLATSVGRDYAWEIIEQSKAQTDRVRYLSLESATSFELLASQHGLIVEAIAQGDAARASKAISTHLRMILRTLPGIVRDHPGIFDAE